MAEQGSERGRKFKCDNIPVYSMIEKNIKQLYAIKVASVLLVQIMSTELYTNV